MDVKSTVIVYNEEENTTMIQTKVKKDIEKVLNKYPLNSIEIIETDKNNRPLEIRTTVEGKHIMIPSYKSKEYKQDLINKMHKGIQDKKEK